MPTMIHETFVFLNPIVIVSSLPQSSKVVGRIDSCSGSREMELTAGYRFTHVGSFASSGIRHLMMNTRKIDVPLAMWYFCRQETYVFSFEIILVGKQYQ